VLPKASWWRSTARGVVEIDGRPKVGVARTRARRDESALVGQVTPSAYSAGPTSHQIWLSALVLVLGYVAHAVAGQGHVPGVHGVARAVAPTVFSATLSLPSWTSVLTSDVGSTSI